MILCWIAPAGRYWPATVMPGAPTHRLELHAADDWAELRPTLPNQRPLLLIRAGTGLPLMLSQDTASSSAALRQFLPWLTILLIAMSIFALTLRTVGCL